MSQMAQFVFDFYQSKLKLWNTLKRQNEKQHEENAKKKLDEEEVLLRGKLNETVEKSKTRLLKSLNIESESSSSSSDSEESNGEEESQVGPQTLTVSAVESLSEEIQSKESNVDDS